VESWCCYRGIFIAIGIAIAVVAIGVAVIITVVAWNDVVCVVGLILSNGGVVTVLGCCCSRRGDGEKWVRWVYCGVFYHALVG
jgi:hypothetical protein